MVGSKIHQFLSGEKSRILHTSVAAGKGRVSRGILLRVLVYQTTILTEASPDFH